MSRPNIDAWLSEIKSSQEAAGIGMYLIHNGVVRAHSRDGRPVTGMFLHVDRVRLDEAVRVAEAMAGITAVRVWVNEGELAIGDDIMYVLVAGDIRPNVFECLQTLVGTIKSTVVTEDEHRPTSS